MRMLFLKRTRIDRIWKESLRFHGRACASLALGVRVCDTVLSHLGLEAADAERLVCVSETDGCCTDAIQVGLQCTVGKRHLLFYKTGKLIFTVYDLVGGGSLRMITRREVADRIHNMQPEEVLSLPEEALFDFEEARPMTLRVWERVTTACDALGEQIPPRESGVQDWPDVFRKFDQQK